MDFTWIWMFTFVTAVFSSDGYNATSSDIGRNVTLSDGCNATSSDGHNATLSDGCNVTSSDGLNATSSEDKFFQKYGNDVHESGVWQPLHRTKNAEPLLLMSVCNQAHKLANLGPPDVQIFCFFTKKLKFKSDQYQPIDIDMVIYSVHLPNSSQIAPRAWFITKGLRSDCVYYLEKAGKLIEEFYLTDQHVCGIEYIVESVTKPSY